MVLIFIFHFKSLEYFYICQVKKTKMTLIKSISGIRGTIGNYVGENLTPIDAVKFAAAYGVWLNPTEIKVIDSCGGEDARLSGQMIQSLVMQALVGLGIDIIDLDLSTTPTVEVAIAFGTCRWWYYFNS